MSDEQIRRIIDDSYDESKEEGIRAMGRDWFSRKMLSTVLFVWAWAIPLIALAVYSAIKFFETNQTREQIMYAALFVVSAQYVAGMKIFAWLMLHRRSIARSLKQVELRVAELNEKLKRE
jgi:hypothetical protein